jgi:MFS transporter, FSR family, fosmidomycin resistance protein
MNSQTFRLVLLVSCAHAMVHMFEHALPAVEQMIGEEFAVGRERTGALGTVWRLPFGWAAMMVGWLTDRWGSKRMLIGYLIGCIVTAILAWWAPTLAILFVVMFLMGTFASIYHPAGLSLISRETTPENRGAALGWHGIFGSLGIAAAPFIAALVFSTGSVGWREYFLVLTVPAAIIAILLLRLRVDSESPSRRAESSRLAALNDEPIAWRRFLVLVSAGALSGFVYSAFLFFLPRYLDQTNLRPEGWTDESFRNTLATVVLLCAAVGQGLAGRIAAPDRLEKQLAAILLANAPLLWWMALAEGPLRLISACLLALVHFMNQPIYNSLIAELVPTSRRSFGYGFSNMICFGVGAFGPMAVGPISLESMVYATLGAVALVAGLLASLLCHKPGSGASRPDRAV